MKKVILATLASAAVSFTASAANAPAKNVKFVGDTEFASFCQAIINNDVEMFETSIKRFVGELGFSKKRVLQRVTESNGVQCAGKSLVEFTAERNATEIVNLINKQA